MRALITGIDGFVAGYLSEYLISQGIEVYGTTVLDDYKMSNVTIYKMDLREKEQVNKVIKEISPDYIYHLAGQSNVGLSWNNPTLTIDINVNGTINLLESIKETCNEAKVLIVGSSDEYGVIKPEKCPVDEEHSLNPINPYAVSKVAQEQIADVYIKAHGLQIIKVRPFNHIGPKQKLGFVIPDFASKIVEVEKGKREVIEVGNLEAARDFSDVRDIVRGYYLLMKTGIIGEVYNIGSGKAYKIKDILENLIQLSNKDIEVRVDLTKLRPSDIPIIQSNNAKINRDTGFVPSYDIKETLKDILEYFREIYN